MVRRASQQFHAINNLQIRELGVGRRWTADQVRSGLLTPVDAGVFVVGLDLGDLPRDTCAMVGLLRTKGPAALSGESAVERLGVWTRGSADLHVTTTGRTPDQLSGLAPGVTIHSHRTRALLAHDVVVANGLDVMSALRAIPELGRSLTPLQIANVIWNSLYAELLDLPSLRARLRMLRDVPHTGAARAALRWIDGESCGTKSASEDEFVTIAARSGLPDPQVNVIGAAGLPGVRLDFVWPVERIVFELDGRHHQAMPGIARSDRAVFDHLRSQGWTTLRAHYSRVWNDPMGVAVMLLDAFRR